MSIGVPLGESEQCPGIAELAALRQQVRSLIRAPCLASLFVRQRQVNDLDSDSEAVVLRPCALSSGTRAR
jgi:hypothetical protein